MLLLPACARQPQPARVEEITFESGSFNVVGDLRLPKGTGPFPVVLLVHGGGPIDRTMFGEYVPVMERMLRAGYATFSWDKPGTGESTGSLKWGQVFAQRRRPGGVAGQGMDLGRQVCARRGSDFLGGPGR